LELSWSTFLLEMINFLVLVWILKHFLYKPVLDVIARRRAGIEDQLADARQLHEEAEALKAEYDSRLAERDRERQQAREALARELAGERARQLAQLQAELAQEREKAEVADSRRRADAAREIEHQALQQGAQFATRLLGQAAGPELQERLTRLMLDGLGSLSDDRISDLRKQWGEPPQVIRIASAFPLAAERQQELEKVLNDITGLDRPVEYIQDPELLAGLRVTIGAWVLHANLQDELKVFSQFAHVAR
jgi:F-type H+-transporting ATPase subunit b